MPRAKEQRPTLAVHHRSDTGRVRDHNEDYLGYRQPDDLELSIEAGWLYAVADGVGGAQAGEIASKLAIQTLLNTYYHSYRDTAAGRLENAVIKANHAVYEQAKEQEGPRRMGTTLVAAVVRGKELIVANVGDSRAYLISDGRIEQITRDHSVVARLVAEGVITAEQAETHPRRHVLSRSIGANPQVKVDIFTKHFHPGDRLLLCSDGLTEHVTDDEILTIMQDDDPETGVQNLVDLANERGGKDNISILVIRALAEREERLLPVTRPAEAKAPVSRRLPWPWIGVIITSLLICASALAAGRLLLFNPTPTATPTATPKPPSPTSTATEAATQTFTLVPMTGPGVSPTATHTAVPVSTDTPPPRDTPRPSPTATDSPAPTATGSPAPTATSTGETSPLATPTPTDTPTLVPTPTATSTTEVSPLPTP